MAKIHYMVFKCDDEILNTIYNILNENNIEYRDSETTRFKYATEEESNTAKKQSLNKSATNYYYRNREKVLKKKTEKYLEQHNGVLKSTGRPKSYNTTEIK